MNQGELSYQKLQEDILQLQKENNQLKSELKLSNDKGLRSSEESEIKYSSLVNNIKDLIFRFELLPERKFSYVSPSASDLTGYTPEEYYSDPDLGFKMVHQEDVSILENFTQLSPNPLAPIVLRWKKKNDTLIWTEQYNVLIYNEEGDIVAIEGIARDITKQKEIEFSLVESEKRYELAMQAANDGIWDWDIEKKEVYYSIGWKRQIGYENHELKNSLEIWEPLVHPDDRIETWEQVELCIAGKLDRYETEFRMLHKKGHWVDILSRGNVLRNENEKIVRFVGTHVDITDIKRTKKIIEERERQLRLAMISGKLGLYDLNIKTGDAIVNKQYAEMLDYDAETFVETNNFWIDRLHPDDKEPVSNIYIAYIAGEIDEYRAEFRQKTNIGKWKWILSIGEITEYDTDGSPLRMLGTHTDIDDIKRAEQELRNSEEKYKAMYINAPLAFQSLDTNGNILDINPAWLDLLKFEREEVIGKAFKDFLPVEQHEAYHRNFPKFLKSGRVRNVNYQMRTKKGDYIHITLEGRIGRDRSGKAKSTYCTFKDISEEHKIKQELIIAKEKAEENDRLKSAFLANMSHEIRTPMNGIMGFANLLKRPRLTSDKQNQYIDIIESSGNRMLNLINDLMDISKIEAGQMIVTNSSFNVHNCLDYQYNFFSLETESKGLKLKLETPDFDQTLKINSDHDKFQAILVNLLKNAIKYTNEGEISFGSYIDKDIIFYIKDSGIGISEDKLPVIFDRFVQADISLSKPYEGVGLGLAITKAYVEMLGGKIWAESEFGKGSTFYFSLPYIQKPDLHANNDELNSELETNLLSDLNIAIAEDDYTAEVYLREILEDKCKSIRHAPNGKELLCLLEKHPEINLILMDIKMPVMDGYEATRKIRESNSDIIIIAQTAYAIQGDRELALSAGCNDYIAKPIKTKELIQTINKNIG